MSGRKGGRVMEAMPKSPPRRTLLQRGFLAVSCVEFQTFQLPDGVLFGVGAGGGAGAQRTWAVLGGTGRFAGARGSYVEREVSVAPAGRGAVEFILTLTA